MDGKKRVLILYADAGFGHRSAAYAVAEALRERYADRCEIELVNPLEDKRAPLILRDSQSDYDKMVRNMPDLYKLGYQASDSMVTSALFESALMVMLFDVMRDVIRRSAPDAIVTTYPLYQAPLEAYFVISRRYIPVFTVVTDLVTVHRTWLNDAVDRCLVPTPQVRELALEVGLRPSQVVVTGIPVHPDLAREMRPPEQIRAELGWDSGRVTALVVGSRRVSRLPETLRVLNHSGLPLQLVIAAGGDDDLFGQLSTVEWHVPTHLYNFIDNMPAMMHAADLILCKAGGLVVTESLAAGKPMLLVDVLPGQETGNADYAITNGAAELGESPIDALESLSHWLMNDGELLHQRAANAARLGRPHAAYDIADLVWTAVESGLGGQDERHLLARSVLTDLLRRNRVTWSERLGIGGVEEDEPEGNL